jgi:hypothetical protein
MFFWLATLPIVQSPDISEGYKVSVFAVEILTKQEWLCKIPQETRRFGRNFSHSFSWAKNKERKKTAEGGSW